ncbi:ferulic acid esterase [Xylogone sp. PMI_703]|nr:ferulic acid esterase [Xylogone sp. PMI_703]
MHRVSAIVAGLAAIVIGAVAKSPPNTFEVSCKSLGARIKLPNVTVNFVQYVPSGSNISLADNPPDCGQAPQQAYVDLCRVALAVKTSDRSSITMETWLPRKYTGRFLSTGNGGLNGCVDYASMAYTTMLGFSTVGANNGHNGTTAESFLNNPDVVADYVYRSVHTNTVVGKEVTKLFYPQGFSKSYYFGCSTGGRQGWKEVQDFPDDFDGVVAGSPAMNLVNLISWGAWFYTLTGPPTADTFLTPNQWALVQENIIKQCDGIDGALDGIIEDPSLCYPDVSSFICSATSTNSSACITETQALTVYRVLGPFYSETGSLLYPRMQPGAEATSAFVYYNGVPFTYSTQWYEYVVFNDTTWDGTGWTLHDATIALDQNPFDAETFNGDISAFKKRGGKVIHYHGTADWLISSEDSKLYYRKVSDTLRMTPSQLDKFYRFFPISGMGHCSGGNGAVSIGQDLADYTGQAPEDNVLMALVQWVEKGIAPDTLRGAKLSGTEVEYRRKHCKYPLRNVHVGPGNYTDENSWQCI